MDQTKYFLKKITNILQVTVLLLKESMKLHRFSKTRRKRKPVSLPLFRLPMIAVATGI
jgi:hypothetical protein